MAVVILQLSNELSPSTWGELYCCRCSYNYSDLILWWYCHTPRETVWRYAGYRTTSNHYCLLFTHMYMYLSFDWW